MALGPAPSHAMAEREQQDSEAAWCLLLVDQLLPLVLPPEDFHNPCLEVLVSEILSEMIFHNGICGKACEPWLIWDGIAKLLRTLRPSEDRRKQAPESLSPSVNDHRYSGDAPASRRSQRYDWLHWRFDVAINTFWTVLQVMMMLWTFLRCTTIALMRASSIQARALPPMQTLYGSTGTSAASLPSLDKTRMETRPIIDMHVWGCMSELFMLHRRAPWLSGFLSLLRCLALYGPGQVGCANSRLDR